MDGPKGFKNVILRRDFVKFIIEHPVAKKYQEYLSTCSSHLFTNPEFLIEFSKNFQFLAENPFWKDQNKRQILWKNSSFVDSGFVKICNELVIGDTRIPDEHYYATLSRIDKVETIELENG